MAIDAGIEYEKQVGKWLKSQGVSNGVTAQSTSDNPDIIIQASRLYAGVELKNQITAAGSLVMKFNHKKQLWEYGDHDKPEKKIMVALGKKHNLLDEMNLKGTKGTAWRQNKPRMQILENGKKIFLDSLTEKSAYDIDLKNFAYKNEIRFEVPADEISNYYVAKGCSYINVGGYGFYTLGNHDPLRINDRLSMLDLPGIQKFELQATSCQYRVRCQLKEGTRYQFVATLEINKLTRDPNGYDIAPIQKGSKFLVDTSKQPTRDLIRALKLNK